MESYPYSLFYCLLVRVKGLEPPCLAASDPKSDTSTNFATPAFSAGLQKYEGEADWRRAGKKLRILTFSKGHTGTKGKTFSKLHTHVKATLLWLASFPQAEQKAY